MKKIIVIALLITGCKKQATVAPTTVTNPIITSVPDKTVTVYSKCYGGNGWVHINWTGDDTLSHDSIYIYSLSKYTTKILATDSINLFYYSKACSVCSYDANDITVTVNGVVKWSSVSDFGNVRKKIKF